MLWKVFDIVKDSMNEKETNQIENIIRVVVAAIAEITTFIRFVAVNIIAWFPIIFAIRLKVKALSRTSTAWKCFNQWKQQQQSKGLLHKNLVQFHRHCLAG